MSVKERVGEHSGGTTSPVPLDRKIFDVIATIDKISDMYKSRIRKPSDDRMTALSDLERKCREFLQLAEKSKSQGVSKLRADAPVFLPSSLQPAVPDSVLQTEDADKNKMGPGSLKRHSRSPHGRTLPSSAPETSKPTSNATFKKITKSSKPLAINTVDVEPPVESLHQDDWEERLCREVTEASELIWAQAEAWIEAEAEAEEEEWRILEMGINKYVGLTSSPNDGRQSPDLSPYTPPPGLSGSSYDHRKILSVSTLFDDPILESPLLRRSDESRVIRSTKSGDGRYSSPNTESYFSLAGNLAGRGALHSKLSSPDRRRSMSPAEALKRYEAKQSAAETNRDKSVAAKVQKAMQVTNRVKERKQRAAEQHQQAEEALHDKLRHAEQRHEKHLNVIRVRAGTENAKVDGVKFSIYANSEAVAQELQHKLEDVEARILAASQRREQRLACIAGSQRKKNTKKAQQMSEFKLQLERLKMDRWEKLQQKLELVQNRRAARLAEMKRRAEAEARRLEAMASEKGSEKATEREQVACSTPNRTHFEEGHACTSPSIASSEPCESAPGSEKRIKNPIDEAATLPEFPASPPRVSKIADLPPPASPQPQPLSLVALQQCFAHFQEMQRKSKVVAANSEAWRACVDQIVQLEGEECSSKVREAIDSGFRGLHALIAGAQGGKCAEDRDASASKLYATVLEQVLQQDASAAETINFFVHRALDSAASGQLDRLHDFAADGGVLLLSVLLSEELGALRSVDNICEFLETSRPYKSVANISRDKVEFGNVLQLVKLLVQCPDKAIVQRMLGCGVHLVIADLTLFLLSFASSKSSAAGVGVGTSEPTASGDTLTAVTAALPELPRIVHSGLHVNRVLALLADILHSLITELLELPEPGTAMTTSNKRLLQLMMDYLFPCNHLAVLVQFGQIVVSELQCELIALHGAATFGAPASRVMWDAMVLREEEGRSALLAVSGLAQVYGSYVRWQRSQGSAAAGIQAKHWLSQLRRNEVFSVAANAFALAAEDMAQAVLSPARGSRSLGGGLASSIIDYAHKLQALGTSMVKGLDALLSAEPEAFQHLAKDQQARLVTALQQALCFHCSVLMVAKPFPAFSAGDSATTATTAAAALDVSAPGKEDAVADICTVVAALCQSSLEARQIVGSTNSSARGAGSSALLSPGQCSLLLTLASLPVRLMKEQRVKNVLMPCLVVACLEVEANVAVVRRCGKASYVRKYLEVAVNDWLEWTRDAHHDEAASRRERLANLTQLVPTDMWQVALLAWAAGDGVKGAKM